MVNWVDKLVIADGDTAATSKILKETSKITVSWIRQCLRTPYIREMLVLCFKTSSWYRKPEALVCTVDWMQSVMKASWSDVSGMICSNVTGVTWLQFAIYAIRDGLATMTQMFYPPSYRQRKPKEVMKDQKQLARFDELDAMDKLNKDEDDEFSNIQNVFLKYQQMSGKLNAQELRHLNEETLKGGERGEYRTMLECEAWTEDVLDDIDKVFVKHLSKPDVIHHYGSVHQIWLAAMARYVEDVARLMEKRWETRVREERSTGQLEDMEDARHYYAGSRYRVSNKQFIKGMVMPGPLPTRSMMQALTMVFERNNLGIGEVSILSFTFTFRGGPVLSKEIRLRGGSV